MTDWADGLAEQVIMVTSGRNLLAGMLRKAKADGLRELASDIEILQPGRVYQFPLTEIPIDLRKRADQIEKGET